MAGLVTLAIALAIALYLCWLMVQPFATVILWATVLAVVFYPMHRRIRLRVVSPSAAAILSTIAVVVLILLPATFITVAVVRELAGAADSLQAGLQRLSTASTLPGLGWILDKIRVYVDIEPASAQRRQTLKRVQRQLRIGYGTAATYLLGHAFDATVS